MSETSEDYLQTTQESAVTNQSASSAGQELSRRQREAANAVARSHRNPRRSGRLHAGAEERAGADNNDRGSVHVHQYHTRSQPQSNPQLRAALGNPIPRPKSEPSSPSNPIGRVRKGSSRLSGAQKAHKQRVADAGQAHVDRMLQRLEDDNPLDDLSLDLKKRIACYLVLKETYGLHQSDKRSEVEGRIAGMLGFSSRSVSAWSREYELAERLEESVRVRHPKSMSPLGNPEYEDFRERLRSFIRTEAVGKGGKPNLTVQAVARWINGELELGDDSGYSERTVSRWMELLDFKLVTVKKTLYVDGHERPDVIADRARLFRQMAEVRPSLLSVDPETLELVPNFDARFILVSQDEKIHHSNDQQKRYWSDGFNAVLPKKSQGRTVMTSDFLSEVFGFIRFAESSPESPGERVGSVLDVSRDGYYNNDQCLDDFAECSRAVASLTDGKMHCVFLTDRRP
ncbi:hypothetical protein FOZ63_005897 [Perkinsus olseni]|uniref:Uncharacterized protein n=1 Tax=Perkinsus olseni TaxID=32597 RepID=A0A7J6QRJ9_PEROL|nr:hypothetical protein FOZ63_005897 [Perkinsus olseni]